MLLNNPNMALAAFTVQPVFALIHPLPTSLSKGITWTSFVLLWNDPDDQGLAGRWWHKGLYNASDWTHAFVTDSAQTPQLWNVRWTVHTFKFIAYMFFLMYLQAFKSNQSNNTCKLGNVCTDTLCYYTCMHNVYTCIWLIHAALYANHAFSYMCNDFSFLHLFLLLSSRHHPDKTEWNDKFSLWVFPHVKSKTVIKIFLFNIFFNLPFCSHSFFESQRKKNLS